jgi:hypothetical protein
VFILRGVRRRARVQIVASGHTRTFVVAHGAATRVLIARRRRSAGAVRLRVLSGAVEIAGVALIA